MEWSIIPAGRVWVDPGGPFGLVPEVLWRRTQRANDRHLLAMDLNCLLIRSQGKTILVDTGLGDKLSDKQRRQWNIEYPQGGLIENLEEAGTNPEEIDIVIDTHLHSDHCGGNTFLNDDGLQPGFPNAEYWVQYIEFADAMNTDARTASTYLPENFEPIWQQGQFHLLRGNTKVTEEVECVVTPGHTRGHQCVLLKDKEGPLLYVADLATFAVHFERTAWVTAYDVEPLENIRTKQIWHRWAIANSVRLIFEHDITMPIGRLEAGAENRYQMRSV